LDGQQGHLQTHELDEIATKHIQLRQQELPCVRPDGNGRVFITVLRPHDCQHR
jgi:hypothetical protein